jgi:hypothetical protein
LHAKVLRQKRGIWQFACEAWVEDQRVAEAKLMCTYRAIDSV